MISESGSFSLDASVSALLQIRQALGLSRKQFGQHIGMNEDTIGKWERGLSTPTLTISQIKRFNQCLTQLNLTWEELPDHIGDPKTRPEGFKRTRKQVK